jgi:drug/metabolite transporter (DMT)-like permease
MSTAAIAGIVLVLIAAAIEALSNVLQHKATNSVTTTGGEASAVVKTLGKPLFLLGFVLMIVGYAFHVASLGLGELAVIQVIFVSQLVFVLPFSRLISKTRVAASDWLGALVVTVGIAVFVAFARPSEGTRVAPGDKWVVSITVIAVVCVVLALIAYRYVGAARAALLGCVGGIINGLVAPLTTETIEIAAKGVGTLLASWQLWVTLIAALLGVLAPLLAFRAGPITASFPAVMSLNPIVATILGVYLFGQHLSGGALAIVMMSISAVVIFIGIVWLSRSTAIREAFEDAGDSGPGGISEAASVSN